MVLAVPLLALTACGQTTGDRALSGAGLGAGVGLLGGALAGSPLTGALLGGALGAGAGVLTSPGQVDLGRPAWR
jgi:osmotically inducible lipoprotein OsmB